jgi:hypothetical protein
MVIRKVALGMAAATALVAVSGCGSGAARGPATVAQGQQRAVAACDTLKTELLATARHTVFSGVPRYALRQLSRGAAESARFVAGARSKIGDAKLRVHLETDAAGFSRLAKALNAKRGSTQVEALRPSYATYDSLSLRVFRACTSGLAELSKR